MAGNADQYEQLSVYLDGELTDAECRTVEEWLERDPEARRILNDLRRVSGMVSNLPRERAPADLPASVAARFERDALLGEASPRQPVRRARVVRWATRSAAVAVVAIGATLAWYSLESESRFGTTDRIAQTTSNDVNTFAPAPHQKDAVEDEVLARRNAVPALAEEARSRETPAARPGRRAARTHTPTAPEAVSSDSAKGRGRSRPGDAEPNAAVRSLRDETAAVEKGRRVVVSDRAPPPTRDFPNEKTKTIAATDLFESRLRQSQLTNADLRRVRFDSLSNRVVLETDVRSAEAMVGVIKGFMHFNGIPVANSSSLPEPISQEQLFYYMPSRRPSASGDEKPEGPASESDCFVMNVQPQQAGLLLTTLNSYAASNMADVDWRANWFANESPRPAEEIIQSLQLGLPFAKGTVESGQETKGTARMKPTPPVDVQSTRPAEDFGEAKLEAALASDTADEEDKPRGPEALRATSTLTDQTPIALAVEIRSRVSRGTGQVLQFPPAPATTSQPTSDRKPTGPATTSRPTSRRSEGG